MLLACLSALAAEVHVALIIDRLHGAESFRYQLSLISRRYCSHFVQLDDDDDVVGNTTSSSSSSSIDMS